MAIYKKAILPLGFKANGIHSGIRKNGKLDLALFYSLKPAKASCLFTANSILAAPVVVCKKYLKQAKTFQAIIANSGNANCFTGKQGLKDAYDMSCFAADDLGIEPKSVLVASTGIIGKKLAIKEIKSGVPILIKGLSQSGIDKAKKAIMTTDKFSKEITVKLNIGNKSITICGIAKGAGMISPNMATMLCFIFTDANIKQGALNAALKLAVDNSFNCITVDGCMSTNDSVMVLANGEAGNAEINGGENLKLFTKALSTVCLELAKMVVKDGEGATKFIQINVNKAQSVSEARSVAINIANSPLFKTAMFASSPNILGRIVAAVGASGAGVVEDKLEIKYSPLKKKEIRIDVILNKGKNSATVYTSDLSYEYVKINAEYN
ncbi:MAG: bifunctional glutamate N-acetyltransferase/amino-acid acetyltransferase ArgJ [Candidatus Omnitrophica bacterium]|nr:bifunctional glutamate N-acetyltransferase/amino-acid acetyltransferase ArgJ [Candidatus Omnitrophota bacterium]